MVREICALLCGLKVAEDYRAGQSVILTTTTILISTTTTILISTTTTILISTTTTILISTTATILISTTTTILISTYYCKSTGDVSIFVDTTQQVL
ncbi:hypothetical protein T484DRAFT_1823597 [Baffinella frigidus]|nr:hypothetical protein T484DRAFT_1823597 [Cryptophyta sp. CCMP2293]